MTYIDIIGMGDTYPVNYKKLKTNGEHSNLFSIVRIIEIPNPDVLNRENKFRLMDEDFNFLTNRQTEANFSVVIVNRPLQGDFFSRRISEKVIAISIFDIETLNIHEGIKIEMYLTRFIYAFVAIFQSYNKSLPTPEAITADKLIQNEAKGCLFDFCRYKPQVAIFFREPKISTEADVVLRSKALPKGFLSTLKKEIRTLKIGRYYKLSDWFKENPIMAIIFTFLVGLIFSELLGNYIYDLVSDSLPFIEKCK